MSMQCILHKMQSVLKFALKKQTWADFLGSEVAWMIIATQYQHSCVICCGYRQIFWLVGLYEWSMPPSINTHM